AHTDEDIAQLITRFKEAADFMLQNSFIAEVASEPLQSGDQLPVDETVIDGTPAQAPDAEDRAAAARQAAGPVVITSTEAQREIWLAAQMGEEANCAFNEAVALRLKGKLNPEALQAAVQQLA